MLYGRIGDAEQYSRMLGGYIWLQAFDKLVGLKAGAVLGITELRGQSMYLDIHTYKTLPEAECPWESHSYTVDLQYMIEGSEWIGLSDAPTLGVPTRYVAERDRYEYSPSEALSKLYFSSGNWAIFFPQDVHKPMISTSQHDAVLKAVIKIDASLIFGMR